MIGMDGSIMMTPAPTKTMERSSPQQQMHFPAFDESTWEEFSSDEDEKFKVVVVKDNNRRRRRILWCSGCFLLLALIVFLAAFFGTRNRNNEPTTVSSLEKTSPGCQSGNVGPRSLYEPRLQILITGLTRAPTQEETEKLETAIVDGYNEEAGGCLDRTYCECIH